MNDEPAYLQIDPTSVCDLKCGYCVGRHWRQGHLNRTTFDALLAQVSGLRYVQLQGEGEPLLAKDFFYFLSRLHDKGAEIGFITNGRHFSEKVIEIVNAPPVRSLGVSLDSLDPEVYRKMRGGDVRCVLDGVRRLLAKKVRPQPDVFFSVVLTRRTFSGFRDIVDLSERLGMSPPSAQELQSSPSYMRIYPEHLLEQSLSPEQRQELKAYLDWRRRLRSQRGLQTYYESLFESRPSEPCAFLSGSLHIRFDGRVFPCCFMKDEVGAVGRLGDGATIPEIWNGTSRKSLMLSFENGVTPSVCVGCPVVEGRIPARTNDMPAGSQGTSTNPADQNS
jgi:MoaA/NifB/PqqE/SkfB family radical SAM enzyme